MRTPRVGVKGECRIGSLSGTDRWKRSFREVARCGGSAAERSGRVKVRRDAEIEERCGGVPI